MESLLDKTWNVFVFSLTYYSINKHVSVLSENWCYSVSFRQFMLELNLIQVLEVYSKFLNGELLDTSSLTSGEKSMMFIIAASLQHFIRSSS